MIVFSAAPSKFAIGSYRYYTCATGSLFHTPLTLLHFLHLSSKLQSLSLTQQSHSLIITHGFQQNSFLATKLVSAYADCGTLTHSRLVFDSINANEVCLWNSLINGYVKNRVFDEAFQSFRKMRLGNVLPDDYTLATLCKVSGELQDFVLGNLIHGWGIKLGLVSVTVFVNSLMSVYSKCGHLLMCRKMFDEMPQRNVASWNVLLATYGDSENSTSNQEVWELFERMQNEGIKPDAYTVGSLLPFCGGYAWKWDRGMELHCFLFRNLFHLDISLDAHLCSSLIDMYARSHKVGPARRVFDQMKCRNIYVWTAIINCYGQNGAPNEAFSLLREMQMKDGIQPNKVSLLSVLRACTSLAGFVAGKQIHGFAIRMEMTGDVPLCNALIDVYSKCGSLDYARRVFDDDSFMKDVISWSSIISAYGLHGRGEEAVDMYNKMLDLGTKLDMITVVSVLSACSKSGLVGEGLSIYDAMINKYGIRPTIEICACMVDMLGRGGQIERALDFIRAMPIDPGPSVWGALLSASIIHGNHKARDLAYRVLVHLEPDNPSNYIFVSNLYASSRKWDVVAGIRRVMKERGLSKTPGCSWITVNCKTHSFLVADKAHPSSTLIYEVLHKLVLVMKGAGRSSDIDVLLDSA